MKIYPKRIYLCTAGLVFCLLWVLWGQVSAATFYLLRHAEKLSGDDPALSEKGQQRAEGIAELLSRADIQVIYSTDYRRTQETAESIAKVNNLTVTSYNPGDLEGLARQLISDGKNAVIVGHSNTTPQLVHILSQQDIPKMGEGDFNLIYQVVTYPDSDCHLPVVNVLSSQ